MQHRAALGREFGHDLIAQPRAQLDPFKPAADVEFGHVLEGEIDLGGWLQDHVLGQPPVVARLQPDVRITLVRDEQLALHIKPIGRITRART